MHSCRQAERGLHHENARCQIEWEQIQNPMNYIIRFLFCEQAAAPGQRPVAPLPARQLLVALLPALPLLFCLAWSHPLAHWDYWLLLASQVAGTADRVTHFGPFVFLNEHIQNLPALLFRLNLYFTHGDERLLSLLTWSCSLCQLLIILRHIPAAGAPGATRTLTLLCLGALSFPVSALFLYVEGSIGVTCMLVSTLVVLATHYLVRAADSGNPVHWYLASLCAFTAAFCHASAFIFFPLCIAAGILIQIPRKQLLLGSVPLVALCTCWLVLMPQPPDHAGITTSSPGAAAVFFLAFLGNPLARGGGAVAVGIVLIALWLLLAPLPPGVMSARRLSFWKLLMLFALGNAFAAALMRSGMGYETALAERYAHFGSLMAAMLTLALAQRRSSSVLLPAAWFVLVVLWPYGKQVPALQVQLEFQSLKQLAARALAYGVPDTELFKSVLNPSLPDNFPDFPGFIALIGHTTGFHTARCQYFPGGELPRQTVPIGKPALTLRAVNKFNRIVVRYPAATTPCMLFVRDGAVVGVAEQTLEFNGTQWFGYVEGGLGEEVLVALAPAKE